MDPVVFLVIGLVVLAVLALLWGRDSRPGFDHRELRDSGPPNVPSSPRPGAGKADDEVPPAAPASA